MRELTYIWRRQPRGSSTPRGIAEHINGVNRGRVTTLSTPSVQSCPDKVVNRMGSQPQGVLASMLMASTASVWQFRPPHVYKCILLTSSTVSVSQFCPPYNCKCDLIRSSTAWTRQQSVRIRPFYLVKTNKIMPSTPSIESSPDKVVNRMGRQH